MFEIDTLSLCQGLQRLADECSARIVDEQQPFAGDSRSNNGYSITRPRVDEILVAVLINGKLIVRRLILATPAYCKFLKAKVEKWLSEIGLTQLDFALSLAA